MSNRQEKKQEAQDRLVDAVWEAVNFCAAAPQSRIPRTRLGDGTLHGDETFDRLRMLGFLILAILDGHEASTPKMEIRPEGETHNLSGNLADRFNERAPLPELPLA